MTEEAQRIAIAEACPFIEWAWDGKQERNLPFWKVGDECKKFDPLHDLNAMHAAEKVLRKDERAECNENLFLVCGHLPSQRGNDCLTQKELFSMIHATAAQRAKAFLRAKGLWVD